MAFRLGLLVTTARTSRPRTAESPSQICRTGCLCLVALGGTGTIASTGGCHLRMKSARTGTNSPSTASPPLYFRR